MAKETKPRIKMNKLLEESGWRFDVKEIEAWKKGKPRGRTNDN